MIVHIGRGAAPGHGHWLIERHAERHAAGSLVMRRGIGIVHREGQDHENKGEVPQYVPAVDAVTPSARRPQRTDEQDDRHDRQKDRPRGTTSKARGVPVVHTSTKSPTACTMTTAGTARTHQSTAVRSAGSGWGRGRLDLTTHLPLVSG